MKLLRYGPKGKEKPGILDKNGKIRSLHKVIADLDSASACMDTEEWSYFSFSRIVEFYAMGLRSAKKEVEKCCTQVRGKMWVLLDFRIPRTKIRRSV